MFNLIKLKLSQMLAFNTLPLIEAKLHSFIFKNWTGNQNQEFVAGIVLGFKYYVHICSLGSKPGERMDAERHYSCFECVTIVTIFRPPSNPEFYIKFY